MPGGFGKDVGDPWHSLSAEVVWAHAVGWQVAIPSNAADAAGLLRAAMRGETERFFTHIVTQDRSVIEFLDADYSFVNESLARLYGIPGVTGKELRRVPLPAGPRGGTSTSPSRRRRA